MTLLWQRADVSIGLLTAPHEHAVLRTFFSSVAEEMGWRPGVDFSRLGGCLCLAGYLSGDLAGGIVVRQPTAEGHLPMHIAWPELAPQLSGSAELLVLALGARYRGSTELLWSLCVEMWRTCRREEITDLYVAVPVRNLAIYRRLGWPMEVVGSERLHWGEPCHPCRLNVAAAEQAVGEKARHNPALSFVLEQAYREGGAPFSDAAEPSIVEAPHL